MKKIFLLMATIATFLFTGCSTKVPGPMIVEKEDNTVKKIIIVKGSYDFDNDKVSPAQNVAIAMKKAALEFQRENVEYFTMDEYMQVPPMITNFENLISYCFPENRGAEANAWSAGSTSLENKCRVKVSKNTTNNDIVINVISEKKQFALGTWSVKEVLEDKTLDEYINNAKNAVKKDIVFSDRDPDQYNALDYLRRKKVKEIEAKKYKDIF